MVQLGKFGAFPSHLLLGLHYDITYEIYPDPQGGPVRSTAASTDRGGSSTAFGQARGKKSKKGKTKEGDDEEDSAAAGATGIKGGKKGAGDVRSNPGWNNLLRPQKRENIVEAVVGGFSIDSAFYHPGYENDIDVLQRISPRRTSSSMTPTPDRTF